MQVSWIDPEDVAALAESLRPSARPKPAAMPEPAVEEPVEPLVPEQQPVAISAVAASVSASAATTSIPEMPNLAAFRQRLQSIREKAIHAGLLTPQPPAPVAAEAGPEPEPEAAPVPTPEASAPVQLAEEASPPVAEEPVAASEPVATEAPQPFHAEFAPAAAEPEPVFTPEPAPVPVAAPEPMVASSAPVYTYTPPQPTIPIAPGASVKDRLDAFAEWATGKWSPNQLLVVDEFGDLLWGPTKKAGLVLSTMMAWNAAIRASAQAASGAAQVLHQSLTTGEALAVIPCQTRLGTLHLAVVQVHIPSDYEITCLRDSLVEVMDIPG